MEGKRWITGNEILKRWQALDFELIQAYYNGLCPYGTKDGNRLTRDSRCYMRRNTQTNKLVSIGIDEIIMHLKNDMFKVSEVLDYEQKHGLKRSEDASDDQNLGYFILKSTQIRALKAFIMKCEGRTTEEIAIELHPDTQDPESAKRVVRRDIQMGQKLIVSQDVADT